LHEFEDGKAYSYDMIFNKVKINITKSNTEKLIKDAINNKILLKSNEYKQLVKEKSNWDIEAYLFHKNTCLLEKIYYDQKGIAIDWKLMGTYLDQ
jgi:hypothetical protein